MNTTTIDDRSNEQKNTHVWGVVAKDKFMSGWGGASGGTSRCAWAVPAGSSLERVYNWVAARKDYAQREHRELEHLSGSPWYCSLSHLRGE
jgi:hypothetical protein